MIIVCFILLLALTFVYGFSCYVTHIHMNLREDKPYDWVKFKTFISTFNKYNKDGNLIFDKSLGGIFSENKGELYLHASIIRFDDKCMILYPIGFFRYWLWKRNLLKKKDRGSNRVKGLFL